LLVKPIRARSARLLSGPRSKAHAARANALEVLTTSVLYFLERVFR